MVVIITGTPGTGKTTLAKRLGEEYDRNVYNITELLSEKGLDNEWDAKNNCFLVDVVVLAEILKEIALRDPEAIIEGHLSHYIDPELVEQCICTKCELKELKKRLEQRGYSPDKIRENLDCEIFDVCYQEAIDLGHNVDVYYTSDDI